MIKPDISLSEEIERLLLFSDAVELLILESKVIQGVQCELCNEKCCEHGKNDTKGKCCSEALNCTGSSPVKNSRCDQCCHVTIDDGG